MIVVILAWAIWWWRSRPTVTARLVSETFETRTERTLAVVVEVELLNHGRRDTSLEPSGPLRYLSARRQREECVFKIQDTDRVLAPFARRTVTLRANARASYVFSHFRVLTLSFSRGGAVRVRVLNASGRSAGAIKFVVLEWCFRLFGVLPHVRRKRPA